MDFSKEKIAGRIGRMEQLAAIKRYAIEDGKGRGMRAFEVVNGSGFDFTVFPDVPVFVRTTILPGTSDRLSKETGHQVCYMPEFLTERTHIEDFKKQTMVFTGAVDLLIKVFPGKKFTVMSPLEAELTKYIHNVFGAYKVTYFNAAKEYVEKMGGNWAKVHTGVLLSGYINDMHTYVPGPDGKFGYGGKCFPKDVNAFAKMTQGTSLGTLLAPLHDLNVHFRGFEEHI